MGYIVRSFVIKLGLGSWSETAARVHKRTPCLIFRVDRYTFAIPSCQYQFCVLKESKAALA